MKRVFLRSDGVELETLYPPYCWICGNPIPDCFAETFPYCAACRDRPDRDDPPIRIRAFGKYLFEDEFPDDVLSNEIRRLKTDETLVPRLLECLFYAIDHECATVLRAHGASEVWSLVLGRMVNRKHLEVLGSYNG